jgi:hypothetical protein
MYASDSFPLTDDETTTKHQTEEGAGREAATQQTPYPITTFEANLKWRED